MKSFSGVVQKHCSTKSSSGSSSTSSSFSFSSAGYYDLQLFKRSISANYELEGSVEGAIAHCKQSQQQCISKNTPDDDGAGNICSQFATKIADCGNKETARFHVSVSARFTEPSLVPARASFITGSPLYTVALGNWMASRGRGRGRGGWGGGRGGFQTFSAQVPFVLFPEDVNLPDVKLNEFDAYTKKLVRDLDKYESYCKLSPYLLEERSLKGRKRMHIERFSDKKTMFTRDSLSQVLMFDKFPKELVRGTSKQMPNRKKFRWNPESELKKLDLFEQKEKKMEGREDKNEKEKKDGDDEDEEENAEEDEGEEDFSDDDYNQNEHFDDDEDDYNDVDDGNDEPTY